MLMGFFILPTGGYDLYSIANNTCIAPRNVSLHENVTEVISFTAEALVQRNGDSGNFFF